MATKKKMLQAAAGGAGGAGLDITEVFSTFLYTGTGSNLEINNGIDLSGEGGLVWVKRRNGGDSHWLVDTERGLNKSLRSNSTNAENTGSQQIVSFDSDGFTLGNRNEGQNYNGLPFASWTFRKAEKFFDVVTYSGNGASSQTISHNLGTTVGMLVVKRTDADGEGWEVYHRGVTFNAGNRLRLNLTNALATGSGAFSSAPTSTEFYVGPDSATNASGGTYVAYLFAHNNNDGTFGPDSDQDIIKCGSVINAVNGTYVELGFEPQFLIMKKSTGATPWYMFDVMRGMTNYNASGTTFLAPNNSNEELALSGDISPSATGFTINTGEPDLNGGTIIYIAIRRGSLFPPEAATEVFGLQDYSGTPSSGPTTGFVTDFALLGQRANSDKWYAGSRLQGTKYLDTATTAAENTQANQVWDRMDGAWNGNLSSYMLWGWKRAPSYFDAVFYFGNATAGRTVSHNLGVAPEMIWTKKASITGNWGVYHSGTGATKYLKINGTNEARTLTSAWNDTAPTSSVFTLGTSAIGNGTSADYMAYLFASLPGISKVGSYTGSNSVAVEVNCGFTSGARFVIIKRTDDIGDWYLYDSVRGIVSSADDPYLLLNTSDAEASNTNNIEPLSSGFKLTIQGTNPISVNGGSYIFYAIA
tara:strand:+ start:313 stop:2241 length:1929 start_codon:yes stop_codon:yes gene_type:complete